jgi:Domain of Unknown Function (DUF1080).
MSSPRTPQPNAPTHTLPAGGINRSRIVMRGYNVQHWLNGRRVLDYQLESEALMEAKAASKFKGEVRWGTRFPTPILLQDHRDAVWFRNIRIRSL